jgi:hypothetical protein
MKKSRKRRRIRNRRRQQSLMKKAKHRSFASSTESMWTTSTRKISNSKSVHFASTMELLSNSRRVQPLTALSKITTSIWRGLSSRKLEIRRPKKRNKRHHLSKRKKLRSGNHKFLPISKSTMINTCRTKAKK